MVSYIKEEYRLKVLFEDRILRRIFRCKMGENREWRRPHNEEFIVCTVHLVLSG